MAKMIPSISLLLLITAVACCWLIGTTAEETIENHLRTERQYSMMNGDYAVPYYLMDSPSFNYIPETRATNYFNKPFYTSPPVSSAGERTFQTLFNLFSGRPLCPACPSCPSCPSCPTCSVMPDQTISVSLAATDCLSSNALDSASAFLPCSRVLAAPKGSIEVAFTAAQSVAFGIVAVAPNTQITLTCTAIPTGITAKTVAGAITANTPVISKGFVQVVATGAATLKLVCTWVSS